MESQIEQMRPVLDISVRNPATRNFTTYEIAIQTSDPAFSLQRSRTRRRFREFKWLKNLLKRHHPLITPPELPPSGVFKERYDAQFIVHRMSELEDWLYRVVTVSLFLSDSALHLFLQSRLSCGQIEDYLRGQLSEAEVETSRQQCDVISHRSNEDDIDGLLSPQKSVSFGNGIVTTDTDDNSLSESEADSMTSSSYDSADSRHIDGAHAVQTVSVSVERETSSDHLPNKQSGGTITNGCHDQLYTENGAHDSESDNYGDKGTLDKQGTTQAHLASGADNSKCFHLGDQSISTGTPSVVAGQKQEIDVVYSINRLW